MQSSLEFFCEECGAANPEDATCCIACQQPLSRSPASLPAPVKPVVVTPAPTLQVVAGATPVTPAVSTTLSSISDSLLPGMLLQNRYRIEREIGQGGYSIVYKAWDTGRHNRPVTIKQINLRNLTPRQVIEATETFNRETTLLPILKHEGIPKFYGHFTDPEHWYLVMEYIPGRTLEEYLQKSPNGYTSLAEALRIGVKLSSILEYLHLCKPPLIFRDVKPANVMLTPNGRVYLIDFGIARSFHSDKAKDTTPLGSPGYAAPEQYGKAQSDARTDIYGLGATLQTLLTGRDPLDLRAGEPSRSPHPLPSYIRTLLDSMMNPDANQRPRNMTVVRESLQNALAKTRRLFSYSLGLGLGIAFFLWGYVTILLGASGGSFSYGSMYGLFLASFCLWGLTAAVGLVVLLIFLALPSKRYIALGMLTTILLAILLFSAHLIVMPWSPYTPMYP